MLVQYDSSSSDSSDSENVPPGVAEAELRRATLVELLEKRAAYRTADRTGAREHPYRLALIHELGKRVGVRCHRVECLLQPGKVKKAEHIHTALQRKTQPRKKRSLAEKNAD